MIDFTSPVMEMELAGVPSSPKALGELLSLHGVNDKSVAALIRKYFIVKGFIIGF